MPRKEAKSMQDYVDNESVFSRAVRASGESGVQRVARGAAKKVTKAAAAAATKAAQDDAARRFQSDFADPADYKMGGHYRKPVKATPAEIKKEAAKKKALAKKRADAKAARTRGGGRYEQLR